MSDDDQLVEQLRTAIQKFEDEDDVVHRLHVEISTLKDQVSELRETKLILTKAQAPLHMVLAVDETGTSPNRRSEQLGFGQIIASVVLGVLGVSVTATLAQTPPGAAPGYAICVMSLVLMFKGTSQLSRAVHERQWAKVLGVQPGPTTTGNANLSDPSAYTFTEDDSFLERRHNSIVSGKTSPNHTGIYGASFNAYRVKRSWRRVASVAVVQEDFSVLVKHEVSAVTALQMLFATRRRRMAIKRRIAKPYVEIAAQEIRRLRA